VGWGGDAIGVADELLNDLPVSWAPYVIYVACLQTHGVNEALLACKDTQSIKDTLCCSQSNTPTLQTHPVNQPKSTAIRVSITYRHTDILRCK